MKQGAGAGQGHWLIVWLDSEHMEHLSGPGEGLRSDVKLPAAQAGELFGLRQERFALTVLHLGAANFGNVLDDGEETRSFSVFVRQGDATDKYYALATVRKIVAALGLERRAMLDCGLKDSANALAVVGMNHAEDRFFARDAVFGIKSVNAEKLVGPDALTSVHVIFKAARSGDLLGVYE